MSQLLYVNASPRGERSYSAAVTDAFIASYMEANPGDEVVSFNVFTKELPTFDGNALKAKYNILHGNEHSEDEVTAWRSVEAVINEFKSADKYVMAVPMWNFNLPYRLKHYIDILVQPTYTFSFSPEEGYKGLVKGKPIFIAYSRGGEYPAGSAAEAFDFQTKYLEFILGFIGFTDIRSIVVEPTLAAGPEIANQKRDAAIAKAVEMAKSF
ncbi:MAG: NAD(P)H-dependent oxidoreductase [Desulfobacterales bacterium]|jgi:FMN-dependent NADH-azoreductase|nr:NAD(P)H-dependent oxidoreductase [Desulfobacterales bacterium]